jgi:hypothetical protein
MFMALKVLDEQGHSIATELESLFYIMLFLLSKGHLHWQKLGVDHHMVLTCKAGAVLYKRAFERKVLKYVDSSAWDMLNRLRDAFFLDVNRNWYQAITIDDFKANLHL